MTLIDRLSKLDGGDREVDAEIWLLTTRGATRKAFEVKSSTNQWAPYTIDETRDETGRLITVPSYTSSVDAAIALAEREYPNERVWINRIAFDTNHQWRASLTGNHVSWGVNPAIALCISLLRAKEASK